MIFDVADGSCGSCSKVTTLRGVEIAFYPEPLRVVKTIKVFLCAPCIKELKLYIVDGATFCGCGGVLMPYNGIDLMCGECGKIIESDI